MVRSLLVSLVAVTLSGAVQASSVPGLNTGRFGFVEWSSLEMERDNEILVRPGREAGAPPVLTVYRYESYGDASMRLKLSGNDPALIVEGPLPDFGDRTAPGSGRRVRQTRFEQTDDGIAVDFRLTEPGIYRIIGGPRASLIDGRAPAANARFVLHPYCGDNCYRAELTLAELYEALPAQKKQALRLLIEGELATVLPDPALRQTILAAWTAAIEGADPKLLDRFPTLPPLYALGKLRPLLGLLPQSHPQPDAPVTGDLEPLLATSGVDRDRALPPAHPKLTEVGYGHFDSRALPFDQAAQSPVLARVLTALAAKNGSRVRFAGKNVDSPEDLFRALIATGHRVEMRNERTYANFLSFGYQGKNLRWPVWIDTGLKLPGGGTFRMPSGHSQHTWRIHGPVVNARVMFFLGISGAGFFAQTDERPYWTGMKVSESFVSGANDRIILDAVRLASTYLRRIRTERETVAKGMPADGYGYLGICNDSNALLELGTRGTTTTYPLLRAAELNEKSKLGDGLDRLLARLPADGDVGADEFGSAEYQQSALCRALGMTPFTWERPNYLDGDMRSDLRAARRATWEACPFARGQ